MGAEMIQRVLVANRGEIAIRIFYTLREMGIATVAVFTDEDEAALHARSADQAYHVGNYLDIESVVAAARMTHADAIHPGYGFLAENAAFAKAVVGAGLILIGPREGTIRSMGDKLEAKQMMKNAGVPTLPTWESAPPADQFPVIVKAVGGGGGKGMRRVETPDELDHALEAAARESGKAFGDDRVFIEKYIEKPRHVEIQILGDSHGNYVHLFERECSIQRRHQKIIEETPSPAIDPGKREAMGAAAVAAAKTVGYLGAGTVEFILDRAGDFCFLEMNTRLQVEHPVTEWTTGTDLVREQIRIANGDRISFTQDDLRQTGHSIECRIYAEDPENEFRPATGAVEVYRPPDGPGIRLDSGIEEGSVIGFHYDPLLAKLITWGPDRDASIARMERALHDFVLLGVRNNIDFLGRVVRSPAFRAGDIDTQFLERHSEFSEPEPGGIPVEALVAASVGTSGGRSRAGTSTSPAFADVWHTRESWRNT